MQLCNKFSYKECYFPALLLVFFYCPWMLLNNWQFTQDIQLFKLAWHSWQEITKNWEYRNCTIFLSGFTLLTWLYSEGKDCWKLMATNILVPTSQTWCLGYAQPVRLVTCINLHVTLVMFNVFFASFWASISFNFLSFHIHIY